MRGFFGLIAVPNILSTDAATILPTKQVECHYAYENQALLSVEMMDSEFSSLLPVRQRDVKTVAGRIQAATGFVNSGGYMKVQLAFEGAKFTHPATFTDFLELQDRFTIALDYLKQELQTDISNAQRAEKAAEKADRVAELNEKLDIVSAINVNEGFPMTDARMHLVPFLLSPKGRARKLDNWLKSMLMSSKWKRDTREIHNYREIDYLSKDHRTLSLLKRAFELWFIGLESKYRQPGAPGNDKIEGLMMSDGVFFADSGRSGIPPLQF